MGNLGISHIDSTRGQQNILQYTQEKSSSNSIFESIDNAIGLNFLKSSIKKYSGLDYITDTITDLIDDGNNNKLSLGERLWEGVKGAGKAVENFVGSQGLIFMGALALGSFVANKANIGRLFNIATKAYFLYEGSKLTISGTKDFVNANTKEEAKNASTTAVTGGIMLYGTLKGIKRDIQQYKAMKAKFNAKVADARAKLEIPLEEELTESSLKNAYRQATLKNHPDRGGSSDAMVEVSQAYDFLSENFPKAKKVNVQKVNMTSEVVKTRDIVDSNTTKTRGVKQDKLDPNKKYVGMQYGRRNRRAQLIVAFTRKYCSDSDVPAHVFGLSYEAGEWWVYETHLYTNERLGVTEGSHKLKLSDWNTLGKNYIAETDIFEADMNIASLEENVGQKYGKGDIAKQIKASILDSNGRQSDSPGLTCAEYLAKSMEQICEFYHLPPWCITPAHFKDYMVKNSIKSAY